MMMNLFNPNQTNQIVSPFGQPQRMGLATLGGFNPPANLSTSTQWTLVRDGSQKDGNTFPPPINDIKWQGFQTKDVSHIYGSRLYWVCGYGVMSNGGIKPTLVMCQWWHKEPINITDYRMLSPEDWALANIYTAPAEMLENLFLSAQLSPQVSPEQQANQVEYTDVIEIKQPTKEDKKP